MQKALSLEDGVRAKIVAAARTEFAAHGRRAASVRAIAARAGVTGAMVNYYFGSKDGLYDIVVEQAQARLHSRVTRAIGEGQGDLPARLVRAYVEFLSEDREFQRLLLREVLDDGPALRSFVRRYVEPLRTLSDELFGANEETFQIALSVFGAVAGYFIYAPAISHLLGEDALSPERLAARLEHVEKLADVLSTMGEP